MTSLSSTFVTVFSFMSQHTSIIGKGLVASSFLRSPLLFSDATIFASGVSNSSCCDDALFCRERRLLESCLDSHDGDNIFLYFSTCSVYDQLLADSPYVLHKLAMERLVLSSGYGRVIRLPQLIGPGASRKTLVPYLVSCIKSQKPFFLQSRAYRNVLEIEFLVRITRELIDNEFQDLRLLNVACPFNISVVALVSIIESELQAKALCTSLDVGSQYHIDIEPVKDAIKRASIIFDSDYYRRVISGYIAFQDCL